LARLRLFGWKVRLLTVHISSRAASAIAIDHLLVELPAPQHQHLIERRFAGVGSHSRHTATNRALPKRAARNGRNVRVRSLEYGRPPVGANLEYGMRRRHADGGA
jgi:hypothetical protein